VEDSAAEVEDNIAVVAVAGEEADTELGLVDDSNYSSYAGRK
jgi:hypothetical protein